jgi:hypothetical protein
MPDYRLMFDSDYLFAAHLGGKDVVVTIERVEAATLTGQGGRKAKKPVLHFEGKQLGLALNKTNAKTLTTLFGTRNADEWVGKRITLYPTETQMGGETVDCIRIRPTVPKADK